MEIYNDLYTQRVAYYQHFGQLILNCVFLIQVKFPKINWKYFNSTPVVRSLPRIGVVASMSILYVVLSQYVESPHFLLLLTIALLVTNSGDNNKNT